MGEKPTDKEIAKKMELPVDKVQEAIDADRRKSIVSLDQLVFQDDDDYCSWGDRLADFSFENMQKLIEDRMLLAESLQLIDPFYRELIDLTYFQDMSQIEIARKMGMSQMQVSRKIKKALKVLHDIIKEQMAES